MTGRKEKTELSERLFMSASMVERGSVAADVGCDHGFTSIWLVQQGICPHVLAMDVNPGPLERAEEHIREAGLSAYIETRLSDGLSAMECPDGKPEADTLLMAGIGGRLACRLMKDAEDKLRRMRAVVVQPQSELSCVRRTLAELGYRIVSEDMVKEGGKFYTAIRAENAALAAGAPFSADMRESGGELPVPEGLSLTEKEWQTAGEQYGFLLIRKRHPVLREYLEDVLRRNHTARRALLAGSGLKSVRDLPAEAGRRAGSGPPEMSAVPAGPGLSEMSAVPAGSGLPGTPAVPDSSGIPERSRSRLQELEAEAALAAALKAWMERQEGG